MSEPTNPLFEEEKAFLERKKLEYERALRGDVAQLKEQTANVGRVAAVSAGLVGSIWLITKAFTSRKKGGRSAKSADDYEAFDYRNQPFGDFDDDQQSASADHWPEADSYFGGGAANHGPVYHSDTESYDNPTLDDSDLDDNGLGDYPDFAEHSSPQHGSDDDYFASEAYGHPESTLPADDSRRLPHAEDFAAPASASAAEPKRQLGPMLVAFAKSGLGKVVLGQAASVAVSLITKAIKDRLPSDAPETPKSSDLADLTGSADGYAHGHPATPQPDAHPAPADAHSSEPLA